MRSARSTLVEVFGVAALALAANGCGGDGASGQAADDADDGGSAGADDGNEDNEPSGGPAGSSGNDGSDADAADTGDEPSPPPPSDNPIDVAIWPRIVAGGHTEIPYDPPEVLCRRMALDFTGRVPTAEAIATHCDGNPEEMARSFMDTPEFTARQTKLWIQHMAIDPEQVLADHVIGLDGIIADMATGTIGYDTFAVRISAHPGFTINRTIAEPEPYGDTALALSTLFLGRAPHGGELAALTRLSQIWRRDWVPRYELGYGYYVRVARIDADACEDPVLDDLLCSASLWGDSVSISLPITQDVLYETIAGDVPPELQAELETIGALLVQQPEFWGEAADHGLRQLLGWWKSTAAQNETDVAEVRSALAAWFSASPGHDVRDLYATIASSILYTRATDLSEDVGEVPPWAIGPTKAMDATQFIDSLEIVFARELGFCDVHTEEPVGRNWYWPDRLRVAQDPAYYGFGYDFYLETAQTLGGCLGAVPEPVQPGLESLFTHIDLADTLCQDGGAPLPDGFDPAGLAATNVDALVQHQFARFLSRAPLPEEAAALDTAVQACESDPSCDGQELAVQLCGALLRSGAFLYY